MKQFQLHLFGWIVLAFAIILGACLGGGATDTETVQPQVSISIIDSTGRAIPNARVKIFSSQYDPSLKSPESFTRVAADSNGRLLAPQGLQPGNYRLIASDSFGKLWGGTDFKWSGDSALNLKVSALRPRYYRFLLEAGTYQSSDSGIAYFPGTDILTRCRAGKSEVIDSVPVYLNRVIVSSRAGWIQDSVFSQLGDSVLILANSKALIIAP